MKKQLLFLMMMMLPLVASAENVEIDGIYYYIFPQDNVAVVRSNPDKYTGSVVIPELVSYQGASYRVTSIDESAFAYCSGLTSVTIPNSVTGIGAGAFSGCTGLTSITIPNSVTGIGAGAFESCTGLTSITIPYSVTSIGMGAFSGSKDLSSIYVDSNNTKYDSRNNCNAIIETATNTLVAGCKNTVIPNSVTIIGEHAFSGCSSLNSITIPNSVTSIKRNAFSDCTKLTSINIPNSVTSIGGDAFYGCSKLTSVIIPNSVTSIGEYAFSGCTDLSSIYVDSNNTKYDSRNNCNAIIETSTNALVVGCKNTVIPNSVTNIGNGAFSGCYSLNSITIPNSVTSIGVGAFAGCIGLTSITLPNSVISIGASAFSSCTSLTSITIGNSVTSIDKHSFYGCSSLTSVTIPNSVTFIGYEAFKGCSKLTSVTIPNSVTIICYGAFNNTPWWTSYSADASHHYGNIIYINDVAYKATSIGITNCEFKESTVSISDQAFGNCSKLTSVTIPNSVTSIGNSAFVYCSKITSITIPNSVTSIGEMAFRSCSKLTSVTIGHSVTSIGANAFDRVDIPTVISLIENPFIIIGKTPDNRTFSLSTFNNSTLYVPIGTIDKYKAIEGWKDFENITELTKSKYKLSYIIDGEVYKSYEVEEGATITPEAAPTKEGYTFSGWSEIPKTMPAHDVTITGTFTVNKYKLTYKVDGVEYKSYDVEYGATISPEAAPTKEGHTFSGWSEIPKTMPAHDVTITGAFSVNKYKLIYKVDGAEYKSYDVEFGATITPEAAPTKEGYTFSGWSEIPATMPAHDVTITGTFTVNKYKLTYKVDGAEYKSYDVEYGTTITPEAAPTKEGYTFSGWSEIPATMPAHDVTITGTFSVNKYKLTYKVDGAEYKSYDVEYGTTITPETAPTKEGYTFSGWSEIPATMPAHDVTVTGTFTQIDYVVGETTYEVQNDEVSIKDGSKQSGDVEIQTTVVINDQTYKVTSIADNAFKGNTAITSVTIPNSITQIGTNAFEGCTSLSEINIGNAVSSIGSKAFANITSASNAPRRASGTGLKVSCYAESVPSTASNAFENTSISNGTLLVEDNSVTAYKNSAPWSGFGTIMGFKEATGIERIWSNENGNAKIFSIDGKPLNTPQKGINIVRYKDGSTKKVIIK